MKASCAGKYHILAQQRSSDVVQRTTDREDKSSVSLGLSTGVFHCILKVPMEYLFENFAGKCRKPVLIHCFGCEVPGTDYSEADRDQPIYTWLINALVYALFICGRNIGEAVPTSPSKASCTEEPGLR